MIRRRWDYFVRYLLGAEPPAGYELHPPAPTPPVSSLDPRFAVSSLLTPTHRGGLQATPHRASPFAIRAQVIRTSRPCPPSR